MPRSVLRIGTTTTPVALARSEAVRRQVSQIITHRSFELVPVSVPEGSPMAWIDELQASLTGGKLDLIVHAADELPYERPRGVVLGGIPKREDPREAVLTRTGKGLAGLSIGATVGTTTRRRANQLRASSDGFEPKDVTEDIDGRIKAITEARLDAAIISVIGLKRLDKSMAATEILPINILLPAPGQGASAIECRATDRNMRAALAKLEDENTRRAIDAERALVAELKAEGDMPIAALAEASDGMIRIRGLIVSEDGRTSIADQVEHSDPEKAGLELASRLKDRGADQLLTAN